MAIFEPRQAIAAATAAALLVSCASVPPTTDVTSTMAVYDPGAWIHWGGDIGHTNYAPLTQINRSTVSRLKIAWRWSADTSGGAASSNFKSTPLLADGVLYIPWLEHGIAAIDAGTGQTVWTYIPPETGEDARGASLANRGLAYWTDGTSQRLFHNSLDGRLIAVDAKTGKLAADFAAGGIIDLNAGLGRGEVVSGARSVSPALVVGDVIVVQVIPPGARDKEATPGDIRGFDARTGALLWTFHVVPRPGEFGYDSWEDGAGDYSGNSGAWSMMSADPELGMVYIPTDTPSNDFSGVERPGDGLFAESIVALNVRTGERVWHFQTVHHGIWDYDNPAAPILHDIVMDGKRIKAVTQLTKQGFMFVFDRATGEPIWPIEERPVPQAGGVPGERLSPTQPFPTNPAPLSPTGYDEDRLIDFTPQLRAEAVEIMEGYQKGPIYTPLGVATEDVRATLVYPGFGGGANWGGAAVDPATNIMYVPIRHRPSAVGLTPGDPERTNMAYVQTNNHTVMGPRGLPLFKPPYAELVAVDMDDGRHLWRRPVGGADDFVRNHPDLQGLGLDFETMGKFDIRPGPLLTGDLIFLGESGTVSVSRGGPMFRAFYKTNGEVVWEGELPTLSTGAPMTYMHEGRQYIVIAVSDRGQPAELVALSLDGVSANGPPPPGGVRLAAMPALSQAAAAAFSATDAELAQGLSGYNAACAACHGAGGQGGVGPSLAGFADPAGVAITIAAGQGEMPAMANSLSPAQIDAISKYVATRFGAL
jgi:glucose dehydrogenase/mono/diheme cytochrome c family protein